MGNNLLLAFCALFALSGLAAALAHRLHGRRGLPFLRDYALHLSFWNGHALVMFIQYILGVAFLPRESWTSLMVVLGPLVALSAGLSLYFLARFAAGLAGRALPGLFSVVYLSLWGGLVLSFALAAGPGRPGARFLTIYSMAFAALKVGTVLGAMGLILARPGAPSAPGVRRALRITAWAYLAGFFIHQLSISSPLLARLDRSRDYIIVLIQVGFQLPVLALLARFAKRLAAVGPAGPPSAELAERLGVLGVTRREAEVVSLVMRGLSNKEIGGELFISLDTVKKHLTSIYGKLGVRNRLQLGLRVQTGGNPSLPPEE